MDSALKTFSLIASKMPPWFWPIFASIALLFAVALSIAIVSAIWKGKLKSLGPLKWPKSNSGVQNRRTTAPDKENVQLGRRIEDEYRARVDDLSEDNKRKTAAFHALMDRLHDSHVIGSSAYEAVNWAKDTITDLMIAVTRANAQRIRVSLWRPDGDILRFVVGYGFKKQSEKNMTLDASSIAGQALSSRRVRNLPDVDLDPSFSPKVTPGPRNYRSLLAIPLLRGDQTIGVVCIVATPVNYFTSDDEFIGRGFAPAMASILPHYRGGRDLFAGNFGERFDGTISDETIRRRALELTLSEDGDEERRAIMRDIVQAYGAFTPATPESM